jgi:hypothetical protein
MAKANDYVGRYGNTLRRLTALERQGGVLAPQQVGGADAPGFGPAQITAPVSGFAPAAPVPTLEAPPAQPAAQAPAQPASGFGLTQPSPMSDDPAAGGISGGLGSTPGIAGPIEQGGDKPTSLQDVFGGATEEEQDQLADQIEKRGKMDGFIAKVRKVLGTEEVPKMSRRETAMYLAEIALRAMSKRGQEQYAQNPSGVFADAVLETNAVRAQRDETRRLEGRQDSETKRKEAREDAKEQRERGYKTEDHARDRTEKVEDDERNHRQALELARLQAKLLREKGQRTSIQVDADGTLKLIDLETGEAVTVTEEVEEATPTQGSRGKGTTGGKTSKVRKPVKAAKKFNASGLDQDTLVNRVSDAEKALRGDTKLMRELDLKFNRDRVKIEAELRRMAREKVQGDVQSLGASPSGGTTDFNDLK